MTDKGIIFNRENQLANEEIEYDDPNIVCVDIGFNGIWEFETPDGSVSVLWGKGSRESRLLNVKLWDTNSRMVSLWGGGDGSDEPFEKKYGHLFSARESEDTDIRCSIPLNLFSPEELADFRSCVELKLHFSKEVLESEGALDLDDDELQVKITHFSVAGAEDDKRPNNIRGLIDIEDGQLNVDRDNSAGMRIYLKLDRWIDYYDFHHGLARTRLTITSAALREKNIRLHMWTHSKLSWESEGEYDANLESWNLDELPIGMGWPKDFDWKTIEEFGAVVDNDDVYEVELIIKGCDLIPKVEKVDLSWREKEKT